MKDIRVEVIEIWSDCGSAVAALSQTALWPRYRSILDRIDEFIPEFGSVCFKLSLPKASSVAKDIARSVTKDGCFNSYLAMESPS